MCDANKNKILKYHLFLHKSTFSLPFFLPQPPCNVHKNVFYQQKECAPDALAWFLMFSPPFTI
jgi:hypothetical protein